MLTTRLLDTVNQHFLYDMANGNASDSTIRDVLFFKTGRYLSQENVKYMKQNTQELLGNDELIKKKICHILIS